MCFLDYKEAFYKFRHDYLMDLLEKKTLNKKDIRIIYDLYYNPTATVKVENKLWFDTEIKRGVRQSCVLSSLLINMY